MANLMKDNTMGNSKGQEGVYENALKQCHDDSTAHCCQCCEALDDFFVFTESIPWCTIGCYVQATRKDNCSNYISETSFNSELKSSFCSYGMSLSSTKSFTDPFYEEKYFNCVDGKLSLDSEVLQPDSTGKTEEEEGVVKVVAALEDRFFVGFFGLTLATTFLVFILLFAYKDRIFKLELDLRSRLKRLKKLPPNGITEEDKQIAEKLHIVKPKLNIC
eukprot:snap_masked-scaffold_1-processed-gene-12.6-mRNA-1 protein AED:1.00 eAED:1.00 QI:0/-1/0/0/-1/1/1/0/217